MFCLPKSVENKYKTLSMLSEKTDTMVLLLEDKHTKEKFILKKESKDSSHNIYKLLKERPVFGIPNIIDIFVENGFLYSIQEYIEGKTLEEILEVDALSIKTVKNWSLSLCQTLNRLHSFSPSIIHRDIKPSNIIISEDKQPFLIDLDIAREENDDNNSDTTLFGTRPYAPPEQFGFSQTNIRSDIYSLGTVIKEMLNSVPKKTNLGYYHLKLISNKATNLDPKKRYSSMKKMETAIRGKKSKLVAAVLLFVLCLIYPVLSTFNIISPDYLHSEILYASPTEIICTLRLPQQGTSFNPEGLFSDSSAYIISGEVLNKSSFSSGLSQDEKEFTMHFIASNHQFPFSLGDTLEFSIPSYMFNGISKKQNAVLKVKELEEENLPVFVLQREIIKETPQEVIVDIHLEGNNSFRTEILDITPYLHNYGGMIDKVQFEEISIDQSGKSIRFILHPINKDDPFVKYDDLSIVFDKEFFTIPMERNREAPVIYLQNIEEYK